MIEKIKELTKKNPQIQKHVLNSILPYDKNFNIDLLSDYLIDFSTYKNTLKNNNYNFFSYKTLESAYDDLNDIVITTKAKKFLKDETSNKNSFLINDETISIIKNAIIENFDLNIFVSEVFRKIVKYKTSSSLNNNLKIVIKNNLTTLTKIKEDIEKTTSEIIKFDNKNKILIANIKSYDVSNKFGSRSWCISTSSNFWNSYLNRKSNSDNQFSIHTREYILKKNKKKYEDYQNYQFFLWNEKEKGKKSLIGFTYDQSLNKIASHYKDDSYCNESIFKYINKKDLYLQLNNNEILENSFLVDDILKYFPQYSYQIFQIILDLNPSYYKEYYNNNIQKIKNKSNIVLYENTKFLSNSIYDIELLKVALEHWDKKDTIPENYLKNLKGVIKNHDIFYFQRQIELIFSHPLNTNITKEDMLDILDNTYIESLSTVAIENKSIKNKVEKYFKDRDLSIAKNINGVLTKTIQRAIKNDDLDWLNNLLKDKKISSKLLSYSSFINKAEVFFENSTHDIYYDKTLNDSNLSSILINISNYFDMKKFHINKIPFIIKAAQLTDDIYINNNNKFEKQYKQIMKKIIYLSKKYKLENIPEFKNILNKYSLSVEKSFWIQTLKTNSQYQKNDLKSMLENKDLVRELSEEITKMDSFNLIQKILLKNKEFDNQKEDSIKNEELIKKNINKPKM